MKSINPTKCQKKIQNNGQFFTLKGLFDSIKLNGFLRTVAIIANHSGQRQLASQIARIEMINVRLLDHISCGCFMWSFHVAVSCGCFMWPFHFMRPFHMTVSCALFHSLPQTLHFFPFVSLGSHFLSSRSPISIKCSRSLNKSKIIHLVSSKKTKPHISGNKNALYLNKFQLEFIHFDSYLS